MVDRKRIGDTGEAAVAFYLECQGYSIVARQFRSPRGEIDLIAVHGTTVAFVEVKTFSGNALADPLAKVNPQKQRRMAATADHWFQSDPEHRRLFGRFDCAVVFLDAYGSPLIVYWYPGAFVPDFPE